MNGFQVVLCLLSVSLTVLAQPQRRTTSAAPSPGDTSTAPKAVAGNNDEVLNIKSYGAKGDGVTNDTPAFNAALRSALSTGGKIYFPPGRFVLTNPNPITFQQTSNSVSIECAGPTSTVLLLKGNGFLLKDNWQSPYFYGYIRDCKFDLSQAPAGSVAVHLVDSIGWSIEGDSFVSSTSKDEIGIELDNEVGWCERNYIAHDSFAGLRPSILFQQNQGDKFNSFAYNILAFDDFEVPLGGDGVEASGPSALYSNYWVLRANMDSSGNLVHAVGGAALRYNYYDIRDEGGGPHAYTLCADSRSTITGNGAVYSFGSGNTQGFTCPGHGNVMVYAQVSAASNASWPNWLGTGKPVNVYGGSISIDGAEGTGNVIGSNISSPFVWMYNQPGNAFVIGDERYPPSTSNYYPVSWFDSAGNGVLTGHLQVGGSHGPIWKSGARPPSGQCTNGSLYSNASGSPRSTLYVCVSGAWADVK